jgi:hypothetical protein
LIEISEDKDMAAMLK